MGGIGYSPTGIAHKIRPWTENLLGFQVSALHTVCNFNLMAMQVTNYSGQYHIKTFWQCINISRKTLTIIYCNKFTRATARSKARIFIKNHKIISVSMFNVTEFIKKPFYYIWSVKYFPPQKCGQDSLWCF